MAIFSINFRREAFQKEQARARQRVVRLGLWLTYFGALGVVMGLYGLNCASMATRTRTLERQTERLRQVQQDEHVWKPSPEDATQAQAALLNSRLWRDRLARLSEVLPPGARIHSLQYNPDNTSGAGAKFVITGEIRSAGRDRMQSVMGFVDALSRDSVFTVGFSAVRLATTRASSAGGDEAEFVVECR